MRGNGTRLQNRCRPMTARFLVLTIAVCLAATASDSNPARAQSIIAFVNGEPITALDVEQRTRILEATTRKRPTRQEAIEELVNDKVKLRQATRLDVDISELRGGPRVRGDGASGRTRRSGPERGTQAGGHRPARLQGEATRRPRLARSPAENVPGLVPGTGRGRRCGSAREGAKADGKSVAVHDAAVRLRCSAWFAADREREATQGSGIAACEIFRLRS